MRSQILVLIALFTLIIPSAALAEGYTQVQRIEPNAEGLIKADTQKLRTELETKCGNRKAACLVGAPDETLAPFWRKGCTDLVQEARPGQAMIEPKDWLITSETPHVLVVCESAPESELAATPTPPIEAPPAPPPPSPANGETTVQKAVVAPPAEEPSRVHLIGGFGLVLWFTPGGDGFAGDRVPGRIGGIAGLVGIDIDVASDWSVGGIVDVGHSADPFRNIWFGGRIFGMWRGLDPVPIELGLYVDGQVGFETKGIITGPEGDDSPWAERMRVGGGARGVWWWSNHLFGKKKRLSLGVELTGGVAREFWPEQRVQGGKYTSADFLSGGGNANFIIRFNL